MASKKGFYRRDFRPWFWSGLGPDSRVQSLMSQTGMWEGIPCWIASTTQQCKYRRTFAWVNKVVYVTWLSIESECDNCFEIVVHLIIRYDRLHTIRCCHVSKPCSGRCDMKIETTSSFLFRVGDPLVYKTERTSLK